MIIGAHAILNSRKPEADRAFLRDVLKLTHVDVGDGWLIFGLPPAEVAIHPSNKSDRHELYLMCDDIEEFVVTMTGQGVACGAVHNQGWGLLTEVTLPSGGKLGVYQPRHARPKAMAAKGVRPRPKAHARKRAPKRKPSPRAATREGRRKEK